VDARSRRAVIALGILTWSVMTAACGAAAHFWQMFLARVGVGAGEAALLPGATSLLADCFPPRRRGLALGVFATGIFLGTGLALIVGGLLIKALEGKQFALPLLGELKPWQFVFYAVGLPGVLVALLMLTVKEPPRLGIGLERGAKGGLPLGEVFAYLRDNRRTVVCHNLAFTLLAFAGYAASAWIPTMFVRMHGWSAGEIGVRFGLIALVVGPLGSVTGGWLCDRLEARGRRDGKLRVGLLAAVGTIPAGIAFPLIPDPWLSLLAIVPSFFFVSFVWGLAPAALQEIMPNRMRGQATALYTGFLNLAGLGLGPTSVAVVAEFVLGDPGRINIAIALVVPVAALLSALLFRAGFRPYVLTLEQLRGGVSSAAGALERA
jgi:MFS family permease